MNPPGPTAKANLLLRRLAEHNDESATAALFLQLYRLSPELRHWLRADYARDAKLRAKVDSLAMRGVPPRVVRFAELTDDNGSWRAELRRLKKQMPGRLYGGLTWNEVVQLVHHYQAGTLDPGTFLLVRQWREAGKASPALMWAGLAFLESVLPSGKRRLLKHLNQALAFVRKVREQSGAAHSDGLCRLVEAERAVLYPPASVRVLLHARPARASCDARPRHRREGHAPVLQAAWHQT